MSPTSAIARRSSVLASAAAAGAFLVATSGCLSIGGKTTQVVSSPELDARIDGIESRVSVLEQAIGGRPTSSSFPPLGAAGDKPSRTSTAPKNSTSQIEDLKPATNESAAIQHAPGDDIQHTSYYVGVGR